ncbi:melanoma-associated antigen C3-like isoform X1 [Tribolium madens]|uniref:melanoma-associated antigen C3-like isoform X1 n=1 Tax=Tribolium madens TaxID=41895 RepID=UPI001CF756E9|nr:melanoma-associated antigen C3-like isoform X1 [Tribolium madens]
MNCWANRNPFQMALILVLMVAVPYFIAIVVTYVTFGYVFTESERCEALCCELNTQRKIEAEKKDEKEQHGFYVHSTDMKPEVDMPSQKTGKQLNNPPEPPLQAPPKEPSQAPPQSPSQAPPEAPPKAPLKGPPKAQGTKPNHGLELDR